MPFDAADFIENPLTFSPGREGLRKLSYVLRHKELWPEDHVWSYECHGGCAMGIAGELWPQAARGNFANTKWMSEAFGIPREVSWNLFLYQKRGASAFDIADAIDRYLETGKAARA